MTDVVPAPTVFGVQIVGVFAGYLDSREAHELSGELIGSHGQQYGCKLAFGGSAVGARDSDPKVRERDCDPRKRASRRVPDPPSITGIVRQPAPRDRESRESAGMASYPLPPTKSTFLGRLCVMSFNPSALAGTDPSRSHYRREPVQKHYLLLITESKNSPKLTR